MNHVATVRREDVFISLCIPEAPATAQDVDLIVRATKALSDTFRYYEVLIVADTGNDQLLQQCLHRCPNLRIISVRTSSQLYASRVVAANEAIGDIVVITSLSEIDTLDLVGLTVAAVERDAILIYTRQEQLSAAQNFRNGILSLLGAASRFHISAGDLRTLAIPRAWLTRLLAHPQYNLALRFPPLGEGFPIHHIPVDGLLSLRKADASLAQRIGLFYNLAIHAAPAILAGVGILSIVIVAGALSFVVYAFAILFIARDLQEGWFTTSLAQAGTAGYLGLAILGLSLCLQKILSNSAPHTSDLVRSEVNNTDLFSDIKQLNVTVDIDHGGGRSDRSGASL